ncbi:MAG: type II toxin-antitoxin system VapC family toxin [Roseateles asaccharophilus]|uniref:Putative nucleic acid-binding protein n=1 Tax=Roseateles asaccharophilus TaxID=582607 RepID=A0A4R6MWE0_9BURK|nr:type II toxin-antitoxin system VapC family toxin [Roseateles asaccharophilus]MDN3544425.1 type II toxin-antitoxin system VapC family toxin [Roseateles asaccharophilus]TDP06506.1 putative nucleic acid-binding protein [Roseateles asaccharophilus]
MIVVDTNILAYLYLPGEFTVAAEALLEREPEWAAPPLWRSEFRNILAGYVRRNMLSFEQACSLQAEAESLLEGFEFEVHSRDVMALVRDSECSAYDCEFVALAERLDAKLVTMDKKVLKAFPKRAISLVA